MYENKRQGKNYVYQIRYSKFYVVNEGKTRMVILTLIGVSCEKKNNFKKKPQQIPQLMLQTQTHMQRTTESCEITKDRIEVYLISSFVSVLLYKQSID